MQTSGWSGKGFWDSLKSRVSPPPPLLTPHSVTHLYSALLTAAQNYCCLEREDCKSRKADVGSCQILFVKFCKSMIWELTQPPALCLANWWHVSIRPHLNLLLSFWQGPGLVSIFMRAADSSPVSPLSWHFPASRMSLYSSPLKDTSPSTPLLNTYIRF